MHPSSPEENFSLFALTRLAHKTGLAETRSTSHAFTEMVKGLELAQRLGRKTNIINMGQENDLENNGVRYTLFDDGSLLAHTSSTLPIPLRLQGTFCLKPFKTADPQSRNANDVSPLPISICAPIKSKTPWLTPLLNGLLWEAGARNTCATLIGRTTTPAGGLSPLGIDAPKSYQSLLENALIQGQIIGLPGFSPQEQIYQDNTRTGQLNPGILTALEPKPFKPKGTGHDALKSLHIFQTILNHLNMSLTSG